MKKYCVEIEREMEDKIVHHFEFNGAPTRNQVLEIVESLDCGYQDDYGRIRFYEVFSK